MRCSLLIVFAILSCAAAQTMKLLHEWKYIDYLWRSDEQKRNAIDSGDYNYTQVFLIDSDRAPDGRIFVTTPRFPGVPASLSTVSRRRGAGGPLLKPYPSWSWHKKNDCSGISSVWRTIINYKPGYCQHLWVLDSGQKGVCDAQFLVFDLASDKLIRRIPIPANYANNMKNEGLLITPAIESDDQCRNSWVYAADVEGGGLIVLDVAREKLRRLEMEVFKAETSKATLTIAGESFYLADGIFGLAVPNGLGSNPRRLYFRPLASLNEYSIELKDLHRSLHSEKDVPYLKYNYTFPSQAASQAASRDGILFFGLTSQTAIACWNTRTPMNERNVDIVYRDENLLQFTSGVKIVDYPGTESLSVVSNRYQKIALGTMDFSEVNFRILFEPVDSLVRRSKCGNPHY
ncbi:major royal jelly protein 1-like [Athalia rosae]|uniref:major royal jelly protein 1-like n=1 Tax=Athalia rosae TaxID=37344 RepID=UPI00203439A7|nr:major royal jelly protein 1-like [Athalia rosae]